VKTDPLADLRDIHLPETISNWPPAYGWWVLVALSITLLGLTCFYIIKSYQKSAYRRTALKLFENINTDYHQHKNEKRWLNDITKLLKRTCIIAYPKTSFSDLSGNEWLYFLDSKVNKKRNSKHSKNTKNQVVLFSDPSIQNIFKEQFKQNPMKINTKCKNHISMSVKKWVKKHQ